MPSPDVAGEDSFFFLHVDGNLSVLYQSRVGLGDWGLCKSAVLLSSCLPPSFKKKIPGLAAGSAAGETPSLVWYGSRVPAPDVRTTPRPQESRHVTRTCREKFVILSLLILTSCYYDISCLWLMTSSVSIFVDPITYWRSQQIIMIKLSMSHM
jgi:hypothetical protein